MTECLFCRIAEGEIPAELVYEGDDAVAFLDANPLVPGHTLVIPRAHVDRLGELEPEAASAFFEHVPAIVEAVEAATGADGATVAFNDGPAAGQEIDHTHLHVVPRERGDKHGPIHALFGGQLDLPEDEMARIGDGIRNELR